jgi:hypothetical protein
MASVAMADYIDNFYNLHRRHSYLGQIIPSEYGTLWHEVQSSPQLHNGGSVTGDHITSTNQPGSGHDRFGLNSGG